MNSTEKPGFARPLDGVKLLTAARAWRQDVSIGAGATGILVSDGARIGGALGGNAVGERQQQGRKHKGEVEQQLPHDRVVWHRFTAHFNEGLEQMNRRNADERGGQFDFEHAGVDVGQPFRLVGVAFEVKPRNESFVASDNDHDEQVGDHDHVDEAQHRHHDGRLVEARRLLHQPPQFFEEMVDVDPLGDDQTDVERGLEPAAQENKIAQRCQGTGARIYGLNRIHGRNKERERFKEASTPKAGTIPKLQNKAQVALG
jgi:hypothetical protein